MTSACFHTLAESDYTKKEHLRGQQFQSLFWSAAAKLEAVFQPNKTGEHHPSRLVFVTPAYTRCRSRPPRSLFRRLLGVERRGALLSAAPKRRGGNPCIARAPPFLQPEDGRGRFRRNEPTATTKKKFRESATCLTVRPGRSPAGPRTASPETAQLLAARPCVLVVLFGRGTSFGCCPRPRRHGNLRPRAGYCRGGLEPW